ncbi:KpsF/GutQ family sugar-phosphate isomerase [Reinekea blandensis]|uniref:Arabinose 5-phosphate isomerase n=1 Tax=Reinekea blandensis MED297 TaxID=314283 RepID=A4BC82_9GAMM|nr:KpsF/GutQ family sugar-phosphate isomerase [Reinekea blandensis]EAR10148.1 predicted sugar phosphate isomerase involved in capsule formation [Reinekea sp. MED297] [Reinekea blandensis MED297]
MNPDINYLAIAKRTFDMEIEALQQLSLKLDEQFTKACQLILNCQGRVVITGMGKSGHIGNKMAATLASTGTPSFFVHPGEASHGDMGMITDKDVVIALSNSGEVSEIITLLPLIKRLGTPLIGLSGNPNSTLGQASDVHLFCGVDTEACPLNLAPTSSTTATLVMGDALAIALLEARGFTAEDFAFSHPGGSLGRKLLLKVGDIMHTGDAIPVVHPEQSVSDALVVMTQKSLGMVTIQSNGDLLGVFTDGDLRRALENDTDFRNTRIADLMHPHPLTTSAQNLAAQALFEMEERKITSLIVTDLDAQVAGVIHMHDILRAGVA